jgi:gliding motility-associated-like protein
MFRRLYILLGLFGSASAYSQTNHILNYSFEQFDSCTNMYGNIGVVDYWNTANIGSPDFYTPCNTGGASSPLNQAGFQYPQHLSSYVGIGFANDIYPTREAIIGTFDSLLIAGKTYCLTIHLNLADSSEYTVTTLGAHFSNDTLIATDFAGNNLALSPQITLDISGFADTSNWQLFEGSFVATGNEQYIVISNFEVNPIWTKVNNDINHPFEIAYYYIDSVSLVECPPVISVIPVIIPNVFTPNEDGINDTFSIQNLPPNSVLKIYNRWGFVVHESTDYHNDWNGTTAGGQKVSDGTYFIYLQTPDGTRYSGTLNVFDSH